MHFFSFSESNRILLLILLAVVFVVGNVLLFRLMMVLSRGKVEKRGSRTKSSESNLTHLLVVLGSGGHTAEMLNMLRQVPNLERDYTYRTYVISSGDDFSALKASEFEKQLGHGQGENGANYDIVTVRRARKVHQSLYTAPFTTVLCLWDCLQVLRGKHTDQRQRNNHVYPDLILTNGPGTGVCVVFASIILLFFGLSGQTKSTSSAASKKSYKGAGQMRTIFIESWARVKTLSLSGQILKPFVNRFLVQWPQLVEEDDRAECMGALVA